MVCRALASTIAFDFTRRTTFQARSQAALSTAVGLRCETTFQLAFGSGSESASWRSSPPSMRFQSSPWKGLLRDVHLEQPDVRLLGEERQRLLP
jgi:hypothetical protein